MTRAIKFRVWDKATQSMMYLLEPTYEKGKGAIILYSPRPIENGFKLMQFTGLKDKNGKEIYEGDIIRVNFADKYQDEAVRKVFQVDKPDTEKWVTEVIFEKGNFVQKDDGVYLNVVTNFEGQNHCEVIGNVYENPELLANEQGA